MKIIMLSIFIFNVFFIFSDEINMVNGDVITGIIESYDYQNVKVRNDYGELVIKTKHIRKIEIYPSEDREYEKIKIAVDATWPPMEFKNESGQIVGFTKDLLTSLSKAMKIPVDIVDTPWDEIFKGLNAGVYDAICSSVSITDERKNTYSFSQPYFNNAQVLIIRKDIQDRTMTGKTVGVQIGTDGEYISKILKNVSVKKYDEIGIAFNQLLNNRIDGVITELDIASDFVYYNDNYKGMIEIVDQSLSDQKIGIVIKKGNMKLLSIINNGLIKLEETGEIQRIKNKWIFKKE